MMYPYERMMDQVVKDRHASLAELYDTSQRTGVIAHSLGSMLIRVGGWLRHDVELVGPAMTAATRPKLTPEGC